MFTIKNETGCVKDTRIVGPDGADLTSVFPVQSIIVQVRMEDLAVRAAASLILMRVDTKADVVDWMMQHPVRDDLAKVASITFADGSVVRFGEKGVPEILPAGQPS